MSKRNVCVVVVDRANYGRLKPVMHAVQQHPSLNIQVLAAGTTVLERFGHAVNLLRSDGFEISSEVYMELEGSTPATMAKSVGLGIIEFTNEYQRLRPDVVVIIGDRYEALSATIAAAYMNLTIVHLQGGEVSGSIDESARHAISKFSHFHVPATEQAKRNLLSMGEREETILAVGCPSSDLARQLVKLDLNQVVNSVGSGAVLDLQSPFILSVFHPTTTEFGGETGQIQALLGALHTFNKPTLMLWPNIDAGADHISKEIRKFRSKHSCNWLRIITNLEPRDYLQILSMARCAVGNSSSFIRDSSYFGTPVVLVGNRQQGRERAGNVADIQPVERDILSALESQWNAGRYPASDLYGDGFVSERVAEGIANLKLYTQKTSLFQWNALEKVK